MINFNAMYLYFSIFIQCIMLVQQIEMHAVFFVVSHVTGT